jgi:predicted Zn-dependent peptidase
MAFVEPAIGQTTLGNGVRVVWMQRGDLPITNMTIALARGSVDAPPGVLNVLLTRLHAARSPALDALGAESDRFVARDASGVELAMLGKQTENALGIAGTMFVAPRFDPDAIEESKRTVASRTRAESSQPEALATDMALDLVGFASRLQFDPARVTASDVTASYRQIVTPDNLIVSIVGSFDPAATLPFVEKAFGSLRGTANALPPRAASTPRDARFVTIDRPKSQQASIAVVLRAPIVTDDDAPAFQVVCEVLQARTNAIARERKGYSYGVRVSCGALFDPIVFISLDADNARAHEALEDILGAVEDLERTPPDERELAAGRVRLGARLVGTFQSNRTASTILALSAVHRLPPGTFTALFERARTVTPDIAAIAIHRWFQDPRVALVGDRTVMTDTGWPAQLGPPEIRSAPR